MKYNAPSSQLSLSASNIHSAKDNAQKEQQMRLDQLSQGLEKTEAAQRDIRSSLSTIEATSLKGKKDVSQVRLLFTHVEVLYAARMKELKS
jgi:hypothetical protein